MNPEDDPRVPRWLFEELQRRARDFEPVSDLDARATPEELERIDAALEAPDPERTRQLEWILEFVIERARALGVWEMLFVTGGFAHAATRARAHSDVDVIVQHESNWTRLADDLVETGEFRPIAVGPIVEILGEQANRFLNPLRFPDITQITMRGVEPARLNGVDVFTWRPFEIARRALGKPVGAPALAFADPRTTVVVGSQSARVVRPEYTYLTKKPSTEAKDLWDKGRLWPVLDRAVLAQLEELSRRAGLVLRLPQPWVELARELGVSGGYQDPSAHP